MFSKKMFCAYGLSLLAATEVSGLTISKLQMLHTAEELENGVVVGTNGETSWQVRPTQEKPTEEGQTETNPPEFFMFGQEMGQNNEQSGTEGETTATDFFMFGQEMGQQNNGQLGMTSPMEGFDFASLFNGLQNQQGTMTQNGFQIQFGFSATISVEPLVAAQNCDEEVPEPIIEEQQIVPVVITTEQTEVLPPVVEEMNVDPIVSQPEAVEAKQIEVVSVDPNVHAPQQVVDVDPISHPFKVSAPVPIDMIEVSPIVSQPESTGEIQAVEAVSVNPLVNTPTAVIEDADVSPVASQPVVTSQTQVDQFDGVDPSNEDPVTVDMH